VTSDPTRIRRDKPQENSKHSRVKKARPTKSNQTRDLMRNRLESHTSSPARKCAKNIGGALVALTLSCSATAGEFDSVRQLSQAAFQQLAKDLASVTALRALSPGVTLGVLGFDVGVEVGVTNIDNSDTWKKAGGGSTQVVTPRVTVNKGLAAGFDVGLSMGASSGTGTSTVGGILRYQLFEPGIITPGATLRLTANRELGSSRVETRSAGADFVVAKPLVFITPYVGIGSVRTDAKAPGTSLAEVTVNRTRSFVGFDARLGFATVSAEAERIGETTTVSSKIGFRF
jgi:hypothetical protein